MILLRIVLLALLAQTAATPPALPASVRGTVRRTDSDIPVEGAHVELRRVDGSAPVLYSTSTASDGSFELSNVRPGEYRFEAAHTGYLPFEFGQRGMKGAGIPLDLTSGQNLNDTRIEMTLAGATAMPWAAPSFRQ
jgi:hypothetical protein